MKLNQLSLLVTTAITLSGCNAIDPRDMALDSQNNAINVQDQPESHMDDISFNKGEVMGQVTDGGKTAAASPFLPTVDKNAIPNTKTTPPAAASPPKPNPTPTPASTPIPNQQLVLTTNRGDITLELFANQAPHTVANFLQKVSSNHYQGLTIHRVDQMVIQGGDPQGNGTGGGQMQAEYNDIPFQTGSLGVARGADKRINNDSQFFICKDTDSCSHLTGQYTNFGRVVQGMDIVQATQVGDTIQSIQPQP